MTDTASVSKPVRRRRIRPGDALLNVWGMLGLLFLFFPIVVIVVFSMVATSFGASSADRRQRSRARVVVRKER